jgi:hypothetical protein
MANETELTCTADRKDFGNPCGGGPLQGADVGARIGGVTTTPESGNPDAPAVGQQDVSQQRAYFVRGLVSTDGCALVGAVDRAYSFSPRAHVCPLYIGIDPGLSGAIALVGRGLLEVADLPVCESGQGGSMDRHIDARGLATMVRVWSARHEFAMRSVCAFLERPIANAVRPGGRVAPAVTIAQQFEAFGAIRGVLAAMLIETHFVTPHRWKKLFGLKGGDDAKIEARRCAMRLYESATPQLSRVKDHNRAEAILIAHYGEGELS